MSLVWVLTSVRTRATLQFITRRSVAHTRLMVWLVKIPATVMAAGLVFNVATQFRVHWLPSSLLGAIVVLFALADKVEAIVPDAPPQTQPAYSRAWEEYRRLRKNVIRAVVLLLAMGFSGMAFISTLAARLPRESLKAFGWILALGASILFLVYAYCEWKLVYWACPRCGHRFRSLWIASIMPKHCSHCGLARWAESP